MYTHVRSVILSVLCLLAHVAAAQTKPVVVLIATGGTVHEDRPNQARAGACDFR